MKRELAGNMALDAGTLLETLFSTPHGIKVKKALKSQSLSARVSNVTITEARYVLCRKLGESETNARMTNLLGSGYVAVHPDSELVEAAAEYKCKRSLSLADCFSLALAKRAGVPVLFARKERELVKEMSREPFDVEVLFLEELS
ncbi:MAG: PIN domain-containing protein [Nitrososphaerota archaeon]|nr:PIN domain-containing protein [Nitrososphaerota archaeon]